jgi:antitoxin PrlF
MATNDVPEDTKVNEGGMVTIPADIRRRLDVERGDKLRWNITDDDELTVSIVRQRYGAFADDCLKDDLGGDSDTHDLAGYESEFAEDI